MQVSSLRVRHARRISGFERAVAVAELAGTSTEETEQQMVRTQVHGSTLDAICPRIGAYGPRLDESCRRVAAGETKKLTGVMFGSHHDVWMELHEDLILTQEVDRDEEGST